MYFVFLTRLKVTGIKNIQLGELQFWFSNEVNYFFSHKSDEFKCSAENFFSIVILQLCFCSLNFSFFSVARSITKYLLKIAIRSLKRLIF